MHLPGTDCGHACVQSSEDEIQVEEFPPTASLSPHAQKGMHPSSSTPALPTHLARESEGSDDNANYARGRHAACKTSHLVIWAPQMSRILSHVLGAVQELEVALCMRSTARASIRLSRYDFFVSPERRILPMWAQQIEPLTARALLLAGQCVRASLQKVGT